MGCEVIITDHHIVQPDMLPPAFTIMNPQLPECPYPFKQLAGVGVVLMLIKDIWDAFGITLLNLPVTFGLLLALLLIKFL